MSATAPVGSSSPDLPELREHIRARRAALAGFMEQGASLSLDGDLLRVFPRNDIYIRYLNDNRASIGELASELYGRKLRVEVSLNSGVGAATNASSTAGTERADDAAENGATLRVASSSMAEQPAMPAPALAAPDTAPLLPQARNLAADRQALYADPVVRRIFEELQGRLVEVRQVQEVQERPAFPSVPSAEAPAALSPSAGNDPAPPAMRRPPQE
jgi:hypothetical protein